MKICTRVKTIIHMIYNYINNNIAKFTLRSLKSCTDLQYKFSNIYQKNLFAGKESRSGEGSNLVQTTIIRKEIPKIVAKYNISSLLDAPCGDWYWMSKVELGVEKYVGVDIVQEMIELNNRTYGNDIIFFKQINLVTENIPKSDLIFSRDCLVHLGFSDSLRIIKNFKESGAKYFLTTTFTNMDKNLDLNNLFWRPLNMQLPPFNFPQPLELINEGCTEDNGIFSDKCIALWLFNDINV